MAFSPAFLAKLIKSPRKWGTILFRGIECGDIKCLLWGAKYDNILLVKIYVHKNNYGMTLHNSIKDHHYVTATKKYLRLLKIFTGAAPWSPMPADLSCGW